MTLADRICLDPATIKARHSYSSAECAWKHCQQPNATSSVFSNEPVKVWHLAEWSRRPGYQAERRGNKIIRKVNRANICMQPKNLCNCLAVNFTVYFLTPAFSCHSWFLVVLE